MRIRAAVSEDARAIAEVHVTAWQAAYRGLMPDSYLDELTVEKRAHFWQRVLAEPRSATLVVAENQASLAGFCLFGPTRDEDGRNKSTGEIIALNVRPHCWRRGVGRALCEFALREAQKRKWRLVTLWVLKGNERAHRFYEALGFSLDGAERIDIKLIGAPLHQLRYSKTL
jgi:ribosomal protein S18 acetylase RimI-like enzyme